MSWCRASEIGAAATAGDVLAVQDLLELYGISFYKTSSWSVHDPTLERVSNDDYRIYASRYVISLDQAQCLDGQFEPQDLTVVSADGETVVLTLPDGPVGPIYFTGVVGRAQQQALSAGDTLEVGDTLLRSATARFISETETAQADDILLVPPELLRNCAVTLGRRLIKRKLDEDADGNMTSLLEDMKTN